MRGLSGARAAVWVVAATAALTLVLVTSRREPAAAPVEVQFIERVASALDALDGRCVEPRSELSRLVLDLQLGRVQRGEAGSALDILHALDAALPAGRDPRSCAAVAHAMFAASD